jgi:CheY-like chemotaxis protein
MQRYLQKEGYSVVTASSGPEGLELARLRLPNAITLDVMMAGMDGWTVLKHLKDEPSTKDIPVVMISMVDNAEMGYALGVEDYLTKPPDRKRLSQILQQIHTDDAPRQILIVDDDVNNRHMLASLMTKTGCVVREAADGRQALACIASRLPDLMLLDLMMPVMDGFEVVAELNRQGLTSRIPIVVLTAKDLTQDDRTRLEGQVLQIQNKVGISRDVLLQEIKGYLNRSCHHQPGTEV